MTQTWAPYWRTVAAAGQKGSRVEQAPSGKRSSVKRLLGARRLLAFLRRTVCP